MIKRKIRLKFKEELELSLFEMDCIRKDIHEKINKCLEIREISIGHSFFHNEKHPLILSNPETEPKKKKKKLKKGQAEEITPNQFVLNFVIEAKHDSETLLKDLLSIKASLGSHFTDLPSIEAF